ncbi:MAG: hypothetical protein AB1813_11635 [Verrucomicrobiota bacterium]|jgi:hypothetical protein
MKTFLASALFACVIASSSVSTPAALYRAGDIVENFTVTDRATGQPIRLEDFAGKIVFLEWFAWW